ncbi:MAG: 3-oxoacyl-[acyl-carrier-protein] reductase [Lachnospiraceae bacterium]|jgi:3-oxoacyl-[acyl-carrier protein] reductase|nr:3-oxoacyl-[acyl-carrier-protein] reductase [Lachnospiraceae bacterium]
MQERKGVIVTGGSRGIGRAICIQMARAGYDVAFNYQSNEEVAEDTQRLCEKEGARVFRWKCDIGDSANCAEFVEKAYEFLDSVDVLVNNAGITKDNLLPRMKDEELEQVLSVNVKGSFYMMREVSKRMLRKRSGSIINMSSVVGIGGNAGQVNYAASKAAGIGMTKSLAKELGSRKIRVNAVAPGMIATDMTEKLPEAAREKIAQAIPFGEMGTPGDVAEVVEFLASDKARYITGQVIRVDGGMSI